MTTFVTPVFGLTEGASFGLGFRELDPVPSPSAGAPFTYKLDGSYDYRVLSVSATFTADATVANRLPYLSFVNEDNQDIWTIYTALTVVAGAVAQVTFISGYPVNEVQATTHAQAPIPDMLLTGGCSLVLGASGIDAGDQFSNVQVYREKYPHGPNGYPTGLHPVTLPGVA